MSGAFYLISHKLNSDYIVIGAGIIGLTTAHELVKRGGKVTVVERNKAGREASWAGGGILATLPPWESANSLTALADASARMYPALVSELISETGIDPEYERSGALVLPPYDEEEALRWRREAPIEQVSVRDLVPGSRANADALFLPDVAQIRTPRLLQALRKRLTDLGVRIVEHSEVRGFEVERERVIAVATDRARLAADIVIVCAGAWSQHVLGDLALSFATAPVKGQMLSFKSEPGLLKPIVLNGELYLVPRRDGHILAGSTTEAAGFDKSTSAEAKQMLLGWAHGFLPELGERNLVAHWAGLRPGSKMPTIDRHPRIQNLYVNSGHFRYGVTMAPGSASLLAKLIFEGAGTDFCWPKS